MATPASHTRQASRADHADHADHAVRPGAVTSSGVRCTIVGTSGDDVLGGTPGRDVICGRGGNDVIRAEIGDDLIDAGPGRDKVDAAAGRDLVLGGPGNDEITGGENADRIRGGEGNDVLISDEPPGGFGADRVNGGPGDNLCISDSHDSTRRCRGDQQRPQVVTAKVTPGTVDVTHRAAHVTVRMHLTDDTGISSVQLYLTNFTNNGVSLWSGQTFEPTSGTTRDGWWKATVTVPHYTPAGPLGLAISIFDRVDRLGGADIRDPLLDVVDSNPDTEGPTITVHHATAAVDVRSRAGSVTVNLTAADAKSGLERITVCLSRPGTPTPIDLDPIYQEATCTENTKRISGTARNGVWTAKLPVHKRSMSGTYDVEVFATDRVDHLLGWLGPASYAAYDPQRVCCTIVRELPADTPTVHVSGAPADTTPAQVLAVTASKTELSTLQTDDSTHVRVHAHDTAGAGQGVRSVVAQLTTDAGIQPSNPRFTRITLTRTSGTTTDGWWEGDLVVPRGTPPGTYHLVVAAVDRAHADLYTDPTGPDSYLTLTGIPIITILDTSP